MLFLLEAAAASPRILLFVFVLSCVEKTRPEQSLLAHKYSTRVVVTKYGPLRGVVIQRHFDQPPVEAFLGVPYATPPLGSLRYMPPVTPSMWKNTRLADSFSPVCPQNLPEIGNRTEALLKLPRGRLFYLEKLLPLLANQSEDCLYLNIYVPRGDREFWYEEARSALRRRLQQNPPSTGSKSHARNVILFVGDGMSVATVTAARILRGQRLGRFGEEQELAWDKFPAVGLVKTYNSDAQIGESSACATALMCGVKANFETLGLDTRGKFENCLSSFSSKVPSLIDWAQEEGKATGIVTNTRITHATPAALFAHAPSRYWEDDGKVPPVSRKSCKDIARQLVEDDPGRNINVILGGGRRHWLPKVAKDPESINDEGRRLDGRNLIDDWVRDKKRRGLKCEYVWNKSQMEKVNPKNVDHLLGLFAYSHMDFETDRDAGPEGDPSLSDMTRTALNILQKNPKGFFLFVEGGRIDHAHHYNNAYRALDETIALEAALLTAMSMVDLSETLIVLTSDHSHVMTMGGLATPRGNAILGTDGKVSDIDGLPYSTLMYGNGPGFSEPRTVPNNATTVGKQAEEKNAVHASAVPRQWATHGGEDVPVYAQGPLATSIITGVMDQSYIPHAIAYAACLGHHSQRCSSGVDNYTTIQVQTACSVPEVSSVSTGGHAGGPPVVIASSVMSDGAKSNHDYIRLLNFIFLRIISDLFLVRI